MKRIPLLAVLVLLPSCTKEPPPKVEASGKEAASTPTAISDAGRAAAGLTISVVRSEPIDSDEEAPAHLAWNENRTWRVGAVAPGRVAEALVNTGDSVLAGQVLARYHSHEVHDSRAALRQARTELARAKAQTEQARRNRDRMKRLLDLKAVPPVDLENAEAEVRNAEAAVDKAEAEIERESQHLTDVLDLPAETDEHKPHPRGQHNEDELIPLRAPSNGVIVERKINPGTAISAGDQAFLIADPESLWAIAAFPERSLPQLRTGQAVDVRVQAFPDEVFHGRIERLGESLDRDTRTLQVRVALAAKGKLKPEMYASVRLPGGSRKALTVPSAAIQDMDGKQTVFVEQKAGQFVPRAVEAEVRGNTAIIRSGLKEGERVASSGAVFLKGKLVLKNEE